MTIVSYDKNYEIASSSITICGRISSDNLFVIFLGSGLSVGDFLNRVHWNSCRPVLLKLSLSRWPD